MTLLKAMMDALVLLPLIASGSRRAVAWSTVGAFLVILGVSAVMPEWEGLASAPVSFLAVSAGFVYLGLGCLLFSFRPLREDRKDLAILRFGKVGLGVLNVVPLLVLLLIFEAVRPLARAGGWQAPVAALGLGGSAVVIWTLLGLSRVGKVWKWLDERWLARKWPAGECLPPRGQQVVLAVIFFAVVTVVLTGNLLVAVTSAMIAVVGSHRLGRERGRTPHLPVQPIVVGLGLLIFTWLAATIAGSEIPLSLPGILDSPLSETAEALFILFLGLGAWALLGLFPFHGIAQGSTLALVGGALLLRWGAGFIPNGLAHAMPLFAVVAGIAVLHAASTGRAGEYAAAVGVLATGSGAGAWGLFALASILAAMRIHDYKPPIPGLDRRQLGGIAMIPALASVLPSALRGETFMTTLAVLAGVALFRPTSD